MTVTLNWHRRAPGTLVQRLYRDVAPFDSATLPAVYQTLSNGETSFQDRGVLDTGTYYYLVETVNGAEKVYSELAVVNYALADGQGGVEPAPDPRINLALDSDDMEGAAWYSTNGITVSGNTLTADGANSLHRHRQLITASVGVDYLLEVDVENVDATCIVILMTRNSVVNYYQRIAVRTSDWTISQATSGSNSVDWGSPSPARAVIDLGGGVYRLRLAGRSSGQAYNEIAIQMSDDTIPDGTGSSTGYLTETATGSIIIHNVVFYVNTDL